MATAGIDFGTTNSVVAIWTPSGPEVLAIDEPPAEWAELGFDRVAPTVIGIDDDDNTSFGWKAKTSPGQALEAVKRLLREEEYVNIGQHQLLIEEAVTLFFAHLKSQASKQGVDIDRVVVTVPANSRGLARYRTRICAAMAGLEVLTLINEPTAAAMAASSRMTHEGKLLVVDLGGGTLDVTLLESIGGVFIEQASSGVPLLGGKDFDLRFASALMETTNVDGLTSGQRKVFQLNVERAKILLSQQEFTNIDLPDGTSRRVTREYFDDITRSLVQRLRQPIEECLDAAGLRAGEIDNLLLVGGGCKIPAVRRFITDLIGRPAWAGVDPMTAIGEGAAVAAAILTEELADNDFFVSTEHALGTIAHLPNGQPEFSTIVPRNHKLPAQAEHVYSPMFDEQESVRIVVVEGRPEAVDHPDNVVLKEYEVELPPGKPGSSRSFTLQYRYDTEGLLRVKAVDDETGQVLLDDDVSFGVTRDKKELVRMARSVEAAVDTGRFDPARAQTVEDPEAIELLQRARSKVIPFLEDAEATPIRQLVAQLEQATGPPDTAAAKEALKKALNRFSYLF